MLLLTASVLPALFLLMILPSTILGTEYDPEVLAFAGLSEKIAGHIYYGDIQGLHELLQSTPPHRQPGLPMCHLTNAILESPSENRLDIVRYVLCQNPKAFRPLGPDDGRFMLADCIDACRYEESKLLLCHPLFPSAIAMEVIQSCEADISSLDPAGDNAQHQDERKFVEFCTEWAPLIFECRDGQTDLLDAYAPGQLEDGMLDLLLDATFFGCQPNVTHQLATLLLIKYQQAGVAKIGAAHKAAEAKGLTHVATFLRMLGSARSSARHHSRHPYGTTFDMGHNPTVTVFVNRHHQLYEEGHGGPHQRDVERSLASVEAEEHA